MKRVLLGFSGGVDSFYAAHLLLEQGFNVYPVYFKLLPDADTTKPRRSAELLNLKLTVVDLTEEFKKAVIDYFIAYYRKGLTPNPCAVCNREIKLKELYKLARKLKIPYIATGHYARVEKVESFGRKLIKRGVEPGKEQSYFLALVEQRVFENLILPLGNLTKREVIEKAKKLGFPFEGESQDVCFIKEKSYADFLRKFIKPRPGPFKLTTGEVLGKHKGLIYYTVGQRRGLGISYKHPLHVVELRPEENAVIVGPKEAVEKDEITVWKVNWHVPQERLTDLPLLAQVRYRSEPVPVESLHYFKNGIYRVKLAAKVSAPAPGQVCAFYSNDLLLGGGEITREGVG